MTENDHQGRTDRLEALLQELQVAQQTGIIKVERCKGGVSEMGSITFLYGQIVDATAGGHVGIEALDWLTTWASCQYAFTPQFPSDISVAQPQPQQVTNAHTFSSPFNFIAQIMPSINQMVTKNLAFFDAPVGENSVQEITTEPLIPVKPTNANNRATPIPISAQQTFSQNDFPLADWQMREPAFQPRTIAHRLVEGPEALTYITRYGLSRRHRHIFFLLDGQRDINDLSRLTGHPVNDIQSLLRDLEQCGLIKQ